MRALWFIKDIINMVLDVGIVFINGVIAILISHLIEFIKHHSKIK